jgi:hypothetical protein
MGIGGQTLPQPSLTDLGDQVDRLPSKTTPIGGNGSVQVTAGISGAHNNAPLPGGRIVRPPQHRREADVLFEVRDNALIDQALHQDRRKRRILHEQLSPVGIRIRRSCGGGRCGGR